MGADTYTVTPTLNGYSFSPVNQPATVTNGPVTGINFSAGTYSISGTVADANGNAGRTVDFPKSAVKDVYAFEISPEGDQPGPKLQSLSLKK